MGCSSREEIVEVFDALDANLDRLCELSFDVLTTPELLRALERLERVARRLRAPGHRLSTRLDAQAGRGGVWAARCAARWLTGCGSPRLTPGGGSPTPKISGERRALTGEPLAPRCSVIPPPRNVTGSSGDGHVNGDPQLFRPPARRGGPGYPRRPPKPTWPARPAGIAPTNWPHTPNGSWTGCTPTANSATTAFTATRHVSRWLQV